VLWTLGSASACERCEEGLLAGVIEEWYFFIHNKKRIKSDRLFVILSRIFQTFSAPAMLEYSCPIMNFLYFIIIFIVSGGHFVIKMFTFFECDTICLLYFLAKMFQSIDVKKPATSKEGNSEVYVVCRSYNGEDEAKPYLDELFQISKFNFSFVWLEREKGGIIQLSVTHI
jgi:hypothetical protein